MKSKAKSHDQNVENLLDLYTRIASFTPKYNPSEERLSITGLEQLRTNGDDVLLKVDMAKVACNNAVTFRTSSFATLSGLLTRSISSLKICGVPDQTIEQAADLIRELRTRKATEPVTTEPNGTDKPKRQNTMHKSSMDARIDQLGKYITFLKTIPSYKPNEKELTIEGLEGKLNELKQANSAFLTTNAALTSARLDRNAILYGEKTGLVDTALDAKLYVKSIFGAVSPEYKSVSTIPFVNRKQ